MKIVSLVSHPDSLEEVRKLGVEIAANIQDAGWEDAVRQGLGGEQILYGLDSVGGSLSGAMLKLMGSNSTLVSFGALSNEPLQIDYKDLIFKQATVRGFWMARVGATLTDERKARMVQDLIEMARKGGLKLPVARVFDLNDAAAAAAASKVSRRGKVMLRGSE